MTTYIKKPDQVEAMQYTGGAAAATPIINWVLDAGGTAVYLDALDYRDADHLARVESIRVATLSGSETAAAGDWVVLSFGAFHTCTDDEFTTTYQEA